MENAQTSKSIKELANDFAYPRVEGDRLPEFGHSPDAIKNFLQKAQTADVPYDSGKILGAMSTPPHPFAADLYKDSLDINIGDRGLNPGTAKIEQKTIQMVAQLLHADSPPSHSEIVGNFTSGGTESNIVAMNIARSLHPEITRPNIVLSEAAHYSFEKISQLMGIELRYAPLDASLQPKLDEFEARIDANTIALIGIAGTSALGLVDPIPEIGLLARKFHKFFHVDAAFGGFVLPFMERLGFEFPAYDFRVPEVCSISLDPHKMGWNVNPSGIILLRNGHIESLGFEIPYLAGGGHRTLNILGTRPGAPVVAFWGLLQYLGKTGFDAMIQQAWGLTEAIAHRIKEIPQLALAHDPQINVVGIHFADGSPEKIARLNQLLRDRGWYLGYFEKFGLLRVVIMPHITQEHIDAFFHVLQEIIAQDFS